MWGLFKQNTASYVPAGIIPY